MIGRGEGFELAAQPWTSVEEQRRLLHFAIVGGGPTGIELSAEINDFIMEDLSRYYPRCISLVKLTIYDVAPRILGGFDEKLGEYAASRFKRSGIEIKTGNSRIDYF